jgi:hypothetical protein
MNEFGNRRNLRPTCDFRHDFSDSFSAHKAGWVCPRIHERILASNRVATSSVLTDHGSLLPYTVTP